MSAIDVFRRNHSIAFLPERLLARSDRPEICHNRTHWRA